MLWKTSGLYPPDIVIRPDWVLFKMVVHWHLLVLLIFHQTSKFHCLITYLKILPAVRVSVCLSLNTLKLRQDGRHFADDIFTCIFFNENCYILIRFSLTYVHKGPIDNKPALVQIMAWRRSGDKPLSEPMVISLPTHICVTWPQWVNGLIRMKILWYQIRSKNIFRLWFIE